MTVSAATGTLQQERHRDVARGHERLVYDAMCAGHMHVQLSSTARMLMFAQTRQNY